jgi:phage terminase large subunit
LFFTANPQSSEDPFSKRFINPYLTELLQNGIYEDDMHLIIMVNYSDNPWFPEELEMERKWDYEHLDRAEYDHIWNGAFNDSVEGSLIRAEWFDACIDAHKKLGFEPLGMKMASHDPSDEGHDDKGYAYRHGSVLLDLQEKATGNVNDGGDWATGLATNQGVDAFTWDCDGLGVGLNRQVTKAFEGKHTLLSQFKGSESPDNPDAIFEHVEGSKIQGQKTNKQAIKNKRAQYYYKIRQRIFNTYQAVVKGVYHDPDGLLSFDSSIELLPKLRSELCRLPVKPNANGLFELYTKEVMKTKFKINSPNLGDAVMMLMRQPHKPINTTYRPPPIKPMGRR